MPHVEQLHSPDPPQCSQVDGTLRRGSVVLPNGPAGERDSPQTALNASIARVTPSLIRITYPLGERHVKRNIRNILDL
jgi:hypothetical protein